MVADVVRIMWVVQIMRAKYVYHKYEMADILFQPNKKKYTH